MAKGDDIEERLIAFAVRIVNLCNALPTTIVGNHFSRQLLRSGTSPAANYAEARGAESTNDFVHKLKIASKELNETRIWLRVITQSETMPQVKMEALIQECDELCRIINASIKTTKSNTQKPGSPT